ncbi:hypothetical protein PTI45_03805 [Paenibacillus nuruki]|uniref:Uncharacterized protein n=1 Tax=Paenibacillus nuruki TaxID=1886670 RepID=A0A1E3KZG8_9BACL|nr:hypothetical protein [Paenibacillus nuruki]ODP26844.1 hypothetical protein PTI45_03805 [Paenibacillus nuruki]
MNRLTIKKAVIDNQELIAIKRYFTNLSSEANMHFQSVFIDFEGYDDVLEQVYEVKEIRTWVSSLFDAFPYLLYFITPLYNNDLLLIACLCDTETFIDAEHLKTNQEYDQQHIDIFLTAPHMALDLKMKRSNYEHINMALQRFQYLSKDRHATPIIMNRLESNISII